MRKRIGIRWIIMSLILVTVETIYFGYNWKSQSIEETICDIIAVVMMIVGIVYLVINE